MLYIDQRFAQLLRQFTVRREVDLIVLQDQFVYESLQQIVDVVAAEMCVAIGGKNLKDVAVGRGDELENGNVEGPAAEIVDSDFAALFFVETVGEGGRSGLVDETNNFEAGDFAGVLGGLALGIVEIGRDGDDGAVDRFGEMGFGPVFQFAENERGNLWRGENFFAEHDANHVFVRGLDAEWEEFEFALNVGGAAAHEAFDRIDGALGLREEPSSSGLAHDNGSICIKANYRVAKRVSVWTGNTLR